ncbi:MAG: triose-phosphate isomerase [Deltaproteobacteria bacterium]|jgi:triosephosphate isomerase (TIM)|nr:triose-phosphate isomerase [Deltaproteobacteria bacterium]
MTKPFIAGNWKMNGTTEEAERLIKGLKEALGGVDSTEVAVAPPYISLQLVGKLLEGTPIKLAAQDLYWEESGAFTGEISPAMLKDVGCEYVIIGHSERRHIMNETDEMVNRKLASALRGGLKPILCVGETLDERERGEAFTVVKRQVAEGLKGVLPAQMREVTIAYEPVWAIGTGKTATPDEAEEIHSTIRKLLHDTYDRESLQDTRILYGGSVKADNVDTLMAQPNIDGALVGGASLKADDFARIVKFQPL